MVICGICGIQEARVDDIVCSDVCNDYLDPEMFDCFECCAVDECSYKFREFSCVIERLAKEYKERENAELYQAQG